MTTTSPEIPQIVAAIRSRERFVISSHSRPDGDSIGSQLAMAYALRALGKHVTIVNKDAAPGPIMAFPGVDSIVIAGEAVGEFDASIIMECSDLERTGVRGLDRAFVIKNMGGLKLFGAVLSAMQIDRTGRIAIVYVDHAMARAAGGSYEDTEGLVNLPLTVKEIEAVVFFKQERDDEYRVSLRSKGS